MTAPRLQKVIELPVRRAAEDSRSPLTLAPPGLTRRAKARRIIAVGGGKGGIGKSLISANLGVALAQAGHRVVLVDADLGGANLHTCLGVAQPRVTLSDFVNRRVARLEEIQVPGGVPNLTLIAGALDTLDAANPKHQQKLKLLRNLQSIETDYLILDLGAGTSFNVLDFFLFADHGILVLLPEPTSVENAYRFVKAALYRRLQSLTEDFGAAGRLAGVLTTPEGSLRTPQEILAGIESREPAMIPAFRQAMEAFRIRLIVNQCRDADDAFVGDAVASAWKRFFGLSMDFLGAIHYDDEAWRAVRKRRPLLLEVPESGAAQDVRRIAEGIQRLGE